jgi:hypothetical protein
MNKHLLEYYLRALDTRLTLLEFEIDRNQKDLSLCSVDFIKSTINYIIDDIKAE